MRNASFHLLFCAMTALAGCAQSTTPADASGADGGGAVDSAGGDGGTPSDSGTPSDVGADAGGTAGPCGSAVPADGAPCAREGLVCEYGSDPRRECRTTATCTGGAFRVAVPGCPPPPSETCPATREAAARQPCTNLGAVCAYGDLACHCTDCPRGAPLCGPGSPVWDCDVPNPDPACPPAMPALGAGCPTEGQTCVYQCGDAGGRACTGGVWVTERGGECPISTRRLKRDIRYLAPDEVDALAAEAQDVQLATYEYTDPALAGSRHLGFVIEDQPDPSYAVEASRARVDLYGYTSLVLATVQSQERRIAELEREIEELRGARATSDREPPATRCPP